MQNGLELGKTWENFTLDEFSMDLFWLSVDTEASSTNIQYAYRVSRKNCVLSKFTATPPSPTSL